MNPIVHRELIDVLRTRKALAVQLGLALACALLVLLRWPTGEVADLSGARSQQVLQVFGYGLLAGVLLLVPAFPATSLVREKIQGTLALLLNSPLTPWSIYLGKLGGVLGFTAVLLAMTLPAAGACFALSGQWGIAALYGLLAIAAFQVTTVALLVSSRARTTDGALRATYALVLALTVLTLAPHAFLRGTSGPIAEAAAWLRCLSPLPAVMEVLGQGDVGASGMASGGGVAWRYALLAAITSVGCALATVARLNHRLLDQTRAAGVMTQDLSTGGQVLRLLFFLVDPQRRSGNMSLLWNPVLIKEFRSRRFGRLHWILRQMAGSFIGSLVISLCVVLGALPWGGEASGGALVLFQVALLILFAPSLAGGLVSAERESGSWQLLRMTPLSAGVILRGKLISVALPLLLILFATLPGYVLVMLTVKPTLVYQVQRVVVCLLLTAVFAVLLSAAASSLFRSTAAATTASYLALLALCGGPLLIWLAREAPFGHATVEKALTIDPVAAALQASDTPGFASYALLPANWWIIGSACVLLLVFLRLRLWQLCRPS